MLTTGAISTEDRIFNRLFYFGPFPFDSDFVLEPSTDEFVDVATFVFVLFRIKRPVRDAFADQNLAVLDILRQHSKNPHEFSKEKVISAGYCENSTHAVFLRGVLRILIQNFSIELDDRGLIEIYDYSVRFSESFVCFRTLILGAAEFRFCTENSTNLKYSILSVTSRADRLRIWRQIGSNR